MSQNDRYRILKDRLYRYQRKRLLGFKAQELLDMQAMSALDEREMRVGLVNPIHDMFGKSQWTTMSSLPRHIGFIPILGGVDGFWQASL